MQIIKSSNIDFINNSKFTIFLSSALILASIFSLIINDGPELSIDFKGGTLIAVKYTKPVNINDLRSNLKSVNISGQNFDFSSAEIKHFGNESSVALRIANIENEPENFSSQLIEILKNSYPDGYPKNKNDFILSIGKVSPKVGSELSGKAIMAIIYAISLILIYISLRFEFVFAIGAIAAIAHDVTITLGIFSILGYEISLPVVAAFLTIVGYSLNDTIVIFDRIRENLKTLKKDSIVDTVNKSINESLSRTIVTSLTTFFVVLILYFFGGEVIRYFSFALIIGVLVGTYSSIFVASLIVVYMQPKNWFYYNIIIIKIKKLEFSIVHSQFGDFGIFIRYNTLTNIVLPNALKFIEAIPSENKSAFMMKVRSQLNQYFKGIRQSFDLKVELNMSTFFISTLEEVKKIPYGFTRSYKDIASNIKSHKGYRAVANANARNPIPIIIPCHRVIKSNGDFGEYGGGSILKKKLLEFEKDIFFSKPN